MEDDSPTVTQEESNSSTPQLEVLQCADDHVFARWNDSQWYSETIQENLNSGKCMCLSEFYTN